LLFLVPSRGWPGCEIEEHRALSVCCPSGRVQEKFRCRSVASQVILFLILYHFVQICDDSGVLPSKRGSQLLRLVQNEWELLLGSVAEAEQFSTSVYFRGNSRSYFHYLSFV
jgi:hypothetical protein